MGISDATENSLLKLIYQGVSWANYADNAASSPQTNVENALHTADPGDAGSMSTSEIAYTSYARAQVPRTTGGFAVNSNIVTPVAAIGFPAGTGGSGTATHWSTGKTGGGAAAILLSGTITPNIVSGAGVTPQLSTASTITLD